MNRFVRELNIGRCCKSIRRNVPCYIYFEPFINRHILCERKWSCFKFVCIFSFNRLLFYYDFDKYIKSARVHLSGSFTIPFLFSFANRLFDSWACICIFYCVLCLQFFSRSSRSSFCIYLFGWAVSVSFLSSRSSSRSLFLFHLNICLQ